MGGFILVPLINSLVWRVSIKGQSLILLLIVVLVSRQIVWGAYTLIDAPEEEAEIELNLTSTPYYIYRKRATWHEAELLCSKKASRSRSRLAVCHTAEEARTLVDAIYEISVPFDELAYRKPENHWEFGLTRHYWIGLHDPGAIGTWVWEDRSPLTYEVMWGRTQPDNIGTHTCTGLWMTQANLHWRNNHDWTNVKCFRKYYFVCEWVEEEEEESTKGATDSTATDSTTTDSTTTDTTATDSTATTTMIPRTLEPVSEATQTTSTGPVSEWNTAGPMTSPITTESTKISSESTGSMTSTSPFSTEITESMTSTSESFEPPDPEPKPVLDRCEDSEEDPSNGKNQIIIMVKRDAKKICRAESTEEIEAKKRVTPLTPQSDPVDPDDPQKIDPDDPKEKEEEETLSKELERGLNAILNNLNPTNQKRVLTVLENIADDEQEEGR